MENEVILSTGILYEVVFLAENYLQANETDRSTLAGYLLDFVQENASRSWD